MALLAAKLDSPERSVRRRAIELLVGAGYRATPAQVPLVERVAESVIRDMVWDMGVLVALEGTPDCAAVRDALETELTEGRRWLFDLLSLVYDPGSITAVREIVETGSPQAMVHALEILDLLISPVLKPFVFPLLEGQTHLAIVRKLDVLVPREQFTPYEALRALVSRGYGRIGLWTRAVALDRLGRAADGAPADLVAFLFHPEAMIREVAAMRIAARDRAAWETHRKRLRFDVREVLQSIVDAADAHGDAEAASIYGRAGLLRRVLALAVLPPEDLILLASSSEVRTLQAGQRLPSRAGSAARVLRDARRGSRAPCRERHVAPACAFQRLHLRARGSACRNRDRYRAHPNRTDIRLRARRRGAGAHSWTRAGG